MSWFFGGAAYVGGTSVFDGTNDYMSQTSSGPTGLADGKVISGSVFLDLSGGDGVDQYIFLAQTSDGTHRLLFYRLGADNTIRIIGRDSGGVIVLDVRSTNTRVAATSGPYTHIYFCFDLTDTAKRKIYFNSVAETLQVNTYSNTTMDLVNANAIYAVGAQGSDAAQKLTGTLSELWIDDIYLDSPATFASGGHPIDPGATGTGAVWFFHGSGNAFNVNSGTGGNMTVTGSLTTTTPP